MRAASVKRLVSRVTADAKNANGLLIPVSGGSDSALAFWACNQALGKDKVVGVFVGENLRCREWFDSVGRVEQLPEGADWRDKEIMRWALFLTIAKERGLWLTGCRNRTEEALGTISIPSRAATYLPLSGLWKTEVMALCAEAGVPQEITDSSRRADPDCGRPREMAEIPLEKIDLFVRLPELALAVLKPSEVAYLEAVVERNAFKQHLPTRTRRFQVLSDEDQLRLAITMK